MPRIYISFQAGDNEWGRRIRQSLTRRLGARAVRDHTDVAPGSAYADTIREELSESDTVLVVIGAGWRGQGDSFQQRMIELALSSGKRVIPVLVDGARMPSAEMFSAGARALADRQSISIHSDDDLARLIASLDDDTAVRASAAPPPPMHDPPMSEAPSRMRTPPRPQTPPSPARERVTRSASPASAIASGLGRIVNRLRAAFTPSADNPQTSAPASVERSGPSGAGAASDPVLLGVTAPRSAQPNGRFSAALAVYVESVRAATIAKLERLGGPGSEPLMDVAPDRQSGWIIGAPVSVRLTCSQADVSPAERAFEWNGRENIAAFSVDVRDTVRDGTLDLCFHVSLAGVPIACIPLPVSLDGSASDRKPNIASMRAAESAFASYSSKDAQTVGYCLSTLARWSPSLEIFQDCLDLKPSEAFKPQLSSRIVASDVFLLFWSRNALASPWVRWEYDTARAAKGLEAVIPMPLEDPRIAPPPSEFEDAHMRDRFMMARYALERIDDVANRGA